MKVKICSIAAVALVSGLLGGMAIGYQGVFSKQLSFLVKTSEGEVSIEDSLTIPEVEEKIIAYIKEEILGEVRTFSEEQCGEHQILQKESLVFLKHLSKS